MAAVGAEVVSRLRRHPRLTTRAHEVLSDLVQWGLPQAGAPAMQWMTPADDGHSHGAGDEPLPAGEVRVAMGMASDAELRELATADGTAADCLFLDLMIRRHEGAIPMAEAVIELGADARVRTVAGSMVAGQSVEIDAMTSMRARLGCGA